MTEHIEGYDELTVEEVKEAVESGDFDSDEIGDILVYEQLHKDRVTLVEWLENRFDEAAEEETDPEPIEVESESEPESEPEAEVEEEEANERPPSITVEAGLHVGYLAGVHFEYPFQHKTVEYTTRIERAIEDGDLRRID